MIDKSLSAFVMAIGATALIVIAAGCVSPPQATGSGGEPSDERPISAPDIDDYVLVDCWLPGQLRRLGTRMTYLAPRRLIKTTKSDCGIRGGEFVLFDRSDYSTALATLLPKARAGDPVAQTYVGEIYEKGLGLAAPDYAVAANWYRKAAEQGYSPAQTRLGSMYERGLGVPSDRVRALNWYRKASGLDKDLRIWNSELEAERKRFRQELALRKRTIASLKSELRRTKQASKRKELQNQLIIVKREIKSEQELTEKKISEVQELAIAARAGKLPLVNDEPLSPRLEKLELFRKEQQVSLRTVAPNQKQQ
jgi:hypothetical protein